VPADTWVPEDSLAEVEKWLTAGGVLISVAGTRFLAYEQSGEVKTSAFKHGTYSAGRIRDLPVTSRRLERKVAEAINNKDDGFPWEGVQFDVRGKGDVYYSPLSDGVVIYNALSRGLSCEISDRRFESSNIVHIASNSVILGTTLAESSDR